MKKRLFSLMLAALLTIGILPMAVWAADLPFVDVSPEAWYYNDVKTAVDAGLVNGKSATTYCPDDLLTYAEAVKLAACMYQKNETGTVSLVNGDPWYQSYVDYAKMKGIIAKDYDWTAKATRAGYMAIFAHALPDASLAAKNEVPDGSIPDVPANYPEAPEIYKLYRAGILQGSDDTYNGAWTKHLCKPADNIKRSEVAAILTRMMFVDKRISFSMAAETPAKPETPKTETLKITKQPQSAALKAVDDKAAFTVEITGGKAPYNYKWWIEKETGSNFQQVDSEKKTSTYNVTFSKDSFTFTKYIRVYVEVTDAEGTKVTSEKAEVKPFTEATADLKITKQPENQEGKRNEAVKFTIGVTGGVAPYTYEWQYWLEPFDTWDEIDFNGAYQVLDDGSLVILVGTIPEYGEADFIRCVVTDSAGMKVTSKQVHYTDTTKTNPLKIVTQPKNYNVQNEQDDFVTFSVTVSGGKAPYTYVWHVIADDHDYTTTSTDSSTTSKYVLAGAISMLAQTKQGVIWVRCTITDANGTTVETNDADLTLVMASSPLKITKQPSDYTGNKGSWTYITITVTGGVPPYKYDWQMEYDYGWVSFDDISTSRELHADGTFEYVIYGTDHLRCVITDSSGKSVTSDEIWVFPSTDELTITKQPKDAFVPMGSTASFSIEVTGGKAPYTYDWQFTHTDPAYSDYNEWNSFNSDFNGKPTLSFEPDWYDYYDESGLFRCVVTDANGTKKISDTFAIY